MGKVAGAQNFDGANWYEQHIAKRTRDALAEQDRAFAEKHAGDSLDQLAAYLRRCAGHWGKSPAPIEIVGGSYIAERFGDWKDALRAAHLNPIYKNPAIEIADAIKTKRKSKFRCIGASVTLNGQHGLSESSNAKANALFTKPQRKPSLQQM